MEGWQQRILAAHARIQHTVIETPIERAKGIVEFRGDLVFKLENQQRTGSFKLRGAANKIALLTPEQARAGVTTASQGNHGAGVAAAAQAARVGVEVYVSKQVSEAKLERIQRYGAEIRRVGDDPLDAELAARRAAEVAGKIFISPYNDADVIAGQGTIAVELARQLPRIDAVFIAVGGGGLISGIGSYFKAVAPKVRIIGCWPENAPALYECMKAHRIIEVPESPTLSESTAGGVEPGSITLDRATAVIDECVLVSEAEILSAMRRVYEQHGWQIEGAAGVAVAAALKRAADFSGQTAAVIVCGGNLSPRAQVQLMSSLQEKSSQIR